MGQYQILGCGGNYCSRHTTPSPLSSVVVSAVLGGFFVLIIITIFLFSVHCRHIKRREAARQLAMIDVSQLNASTGQMGQIALIVISLQVDHADPCEDFSCERSVQKIRLS
ncbi:hypothetical protein PROFUN_09191 [Planoprotostelium fungivorum]|uniref:Uncharacterized protein n=1 Tax=Planoprotostelium fungivorum TaxID=1890364 RepID=A0A2P6NHI6_9EUKA|nr:hypothetical protein PROFUN_09191 [Planoprotostelium fungivorum]